MIFREIPGFYCQILSTEFRVREIITLLEHCETGVQTSIHKTQCSFSTSRAIGWCYLCRFMLLSKVLDAGKLNLWK